MRHRNTRKPASRKDFRDAGTFPEFLANKKDEDYIWRRAPGEWRLAKFAQEKSTPHKTANQMTGDFDGLKVCLHVVPNPPTNNMIGREL